MSYMRSVNNWKFSTKTTDDKMKDKNIWLKSYNDAGIPFYFSREGKASQWEHPSYEELMEEMIPFNDIKYSAYRIAFKFDKIQKRIMFNDVALRNVVAGFERAQLNAAANDDLISIESVETILLNIYKTTYDKQAGYINHKYSLDVALNFITNVYDQCRSGNVQVLSLKVILVLLSSSELTDKFVYLYNQVADHNNCISRKRLALLLKDVAQIAELFSEIIPFGIPTVARAVESCFAGIQANASANEEQFTSWLEKEPESIVWYYSFYRLQIAQTVTHYIRCRTCRRKPITGFRYRCTQCLQSTFCQDCFLYGLTKMNHDTSHPVREFCHQVTKKETRCVLGEIFWNKIRKSKTCGLKRSCLEFSDITPAHSTGSLLQDSLLHMTTESQRPPIRDQLPQESSFYLRPRTVYSSEELLMDAASVDLTEKESTTKLDSTDCAIQSDRIDGILEQLQHDHRELKQALSMASHIPANIIEKHTAALDTEIDRLKMCLRDSFRHPKNKRNDLTSTRNEIPLSSTVTEYDISPELLALSPIACPEQPSSIYATSIVETLTPLERTDELECSKTKNFRQDTTGIYNHSDFFLHGLNDLTSINLDHELDLELSRIEINQLAAGEAVSLQKKLDSELDALCVQLHEETNCNNELNRETVFMMELKNGVQHLEEIGHILISGDFSDPQ